MLGRARVPVRSVAVVVLVLVAAVEEMTVIGGGSEVVVMHRRSVARRLMGATVRISRSGRPARLAGR